MQSTVRRTLEESVVSYEEKPRDQWLFDYPAQIALTGSQIWWTSDVRISLVLEANRDVMWDYGVSFGKCKRSFL